jgi:DNA-binding response OmpR family regulator
MPSDVVAVFNTSEDTTDLLRMALERAGFIVVTAFTNLLRDGKTDVESFMRQHRPKVLVFDIAIPYEASWRLFEHFRDCAACEGVRFILTTTNLKHVRDVAGAEPRIYEIVGKPYDIGIVIQAVTEAMQGAKTV